MSELLEFMWRVSPVADGDVGAPIDDKVRDFIEVLTFAKAEEILTALREIGTQDLMAVPVWARNLAYRLAVLQRPDDADLLLEASTDLFFFGPDWDPVAEEMKQRAEQMKEAK
jgi:hypothetical protein